MERRRKYKGIVNSDQAHLIELRTRLLEDGVFPALTQQSLETWLYSKPRSICGLIERAGWGWVDYVSKCSSGLPLD